MYASCNTQTGAGAALPEERNDGKQPGASLTSAPPAWRVRRGTLRSTHALASNLRGGEGGVWGHGQFAEAACSKAS